MAVNIHGLAARQRAADLARGHLAQRPGSPIAREITSFMISLVPP